MVTTILARFHQIDVLIRESRTGTPAELARTIGVSERTIYEYIKQMKQAGAPIAFNMLTKNYYYKEDGHFTCTFSFASEHSSKTLVRSMKDYLEMVNQHLEIVYN